MSYSDQWHFRRLNLELYRCISPTIATDLVLITNNRIRHIMERHPDSYHEVLRELDAAIQDPDYILRDGSHTDTGLVVRRLSGNQDSAFVVLRICTDPANDIPANTIITGWKVSPKRLGEYLRTGEIIYRRPESC